MIFTLLGSLGNLIGPDLIVVFVIMASLGAGAVGLVVFLVRRGTASGSSVSHEARLRKLDALRSVRLISQAEYDEQRRRILAEL